MAFSFFYDRWYCNKGHGTVQKSANCPPSEKRYCRDITLSVPQQHWSSKLKQRKKSSQWRKCCWACQMALKQDGFVWFVFLVFFVITKLHKTRTDDDPGLQNSISRSVWLTLENCNFWLSRFGQQLLSQLFLRPAQWWFSPSEHWKAELLKLCRAFCGAGGHLAKEAAVLLYELITSSGCASRAY